MKQLSATSKLLAPDEKQLVTAGDKQLVKAGEKQLVTAWQPAEDDETVSNALAEIRRWLDDNKHRLVCRDDANFLLRFLRMKKFRIAETIAVLQKYLRMRQTEPQYFSQLDVYDSAIDDLVTRGYMFALPERDSAGRRVIVSRGSRVDPSRHTPAQVFRVNMLTFETLLEDEVNQSRGFTYLFDQRGIGFSHVFMWSPSQVAHLVSCSESAMPMRHQQMNFVNMGVLMQTALEFVKSLISKKLQTRFVVHSTCETLHNALPPHILPSEYGGTGCMQTMIDAWKAELLASRSRLLDLDQLGYTDENGRK